MFKQIIKFAEIKIKKNMPINKIQGLRGLRSFSELSNEERDAFMKSNANILNQYHNLNNRDKAANILYMNQKFIDKYGIQKFNEMNNDSESSFDLRNQIYKEDVVNTEFNKLYSPFNADGTRNNNKGLGANFEKYSQLSTDGKLKLLESNYLTPSEFESQWRKEQNKIAKAQEASNKGFSGFLRKFAMGTDPNGMYVDPSTNEVDWNNESSKKVKLDANNKILTNIYNDDVDTAAKRFGEQVSAAYMDPSLAKLSDIQVKKAFIKAITPGSYKDKNGIPNLGISELASHYGNGTAEQISSEMQNFSINDMREFLAKKKVYDANMSPDMAATALNNDAKRYITQHQGKLKKLGLFAKDVAISSMSYTADKMNGIAELYRAGQDAFLEKPTVMIDDKGTVLDPNKVHVVKDRKGNLHYQDSDGQMHSVHKEQIDYTTLHNMGKNTDGSDIKGPVGYDWLTLNPQYWSRAEQFGTLDANLQKQYEKLGSSPYKVSYNPNEEGDLMYEAFKMMSFGLADTAAQLIPYGIGKIGSTLSTASKLGKAVNYFGKVLDTTGKMLTAETKVGQVVQGSAGALGIAYAYNRGAFQETLQQNLAKAEETATTASRNDIYNMYHNNKKYKANIDKLINAKAASMKAAYLAQIQRDGSMKVANMSAIDKMLHAKAQDAVLAEQVQNRIKERMSSRDYANLQQKAIDKAGDTAFNAFVTESLKYGYVNTLGYRKYLYTNPSGLQKKVSSALKGLKEITTSAGRKRLATEGSKFLTTADKWKEFGKTLGSQAWGGAWTNGTDDMQVDAAERINEDSFNRYLHAYQNGEAQAELYGFADGIYSYIKGLQNSLGQDTTWNSATVGALGSIVNFTPNFANIARLATKEGREAYKNNFWREAKRDSEGNLEKDEKGNVQYKELGKKHDWRGQVNYFIQNGVLNNYYGKKQSERDLQSHADYVNGLLDEYNDFKDIEGLIASNLATENAVGIGDQKTLQFIKALHAVNALNRLGNDSNDPTTLSSVVQNAKELIDKASQLNSEDGKNPFGEEEISNLLSQYYAANPGLAHSEYNSQKALYDIAQNAQKLKEASEAFDKAETEIQKIEKNTGKPIDSDVRTRMKIKQALNGHWTERNNQMKSEIGDSSVDAPITDASVAIASVGGRKNAQDLVKVYDRQLSEMDKDIAHRKERTQKLEEEYQQAIKATHEAKESGDSDAVLTATKAEEEAKVKYESSQEAVKYFEDMRAMTVSKKETLQGNMKTDNTEGNLLKSNVAQEELSRYQAKLKALKEERKKYLENDGTPKEGYTDKVAEIDKQIEGYEKNVSSRTEQVNIYKDRVLTADEIFALDSVTRARMLKAENRDLYSKEQQSEIEKLEKRLYMKDGDALQKIQDIALLTQRIKANEDAYVRMAKNPEAAAYSLEEQRMQAAETAYNLINQKNAEATANFVKEFDDAMKGHTDVSVEAKNHFVYKTLRKMNSELLDIIDEDNLLPQYQKQIADAKEWNRTVGDISAVISKADKDDTWKMNALQNINNLVENANTKEEIIANIEKVIDDTEGTDAAEDLEYILNGMENLGYQRDATTLENRKKRKEREEAERKQREEAQKKAEEAAKVAAKKKAEEEVELKDTEDVPLFDDTEEGNEMEDNSQESQVLDEEDIQQIPDGEMNVKKLFIDDFKGNAVDSGEMWYGNSATTHKGNFISSREGDKIIFSIGENKESLNIVPEEYETITDEQEGKKDTAFTAKSIEKKNGDWYFIGNFAGENKQSEVKVSKKFDIDRAIERQQAERESELAAKGIDVGNKNIINNEDSVQGKSLTLDEQAEEASSIEGKEIHTSEENTDAMEENIQGEHSIETQATTLGGNAMSAYKPDVLANDGILEHKRGSKEDDKMNLYYAWMNAAGIKLQNIIDHELARIIKRNPHAKVKFMAITMTHNATHDNDMQTHLMLVMDYDNSINKGITAIHDDANGGVIESNGKKYLIIGTASYGDRNASKRALYDILWSNSPKSPNGYGIMKLGRQKFFAEHPNERFYVNDDVTTEIVPKSQIPGYIVRQTESDTEPRFRSVKELLTDDNRNPQHITFDEAAWGIQEISKFLVVGASIENVMVPRNPIGNSGSAFVLIPASNGKMVPSYLKVLKYNEMRNGTLKERVNQLLQSVVSPNYKTRYGAVMELSNIFYFDKDNDFILLSKNKDLISLVHDGKVFKTFVLNNDFDRSQFMQAIEEMNPRVNVTAKVLRDKDMLNEYDEAGALMTDAALFATAGSSYSIYGVDKDGNMLQPGTISNTSVKGGSSDFKSGDRSQVVFRHNYYTFKDGSYYLDGKLITDEKEIKQLDYNKRIIDNGLAPSSSKGVLDYYIFNAGEHPEVISLNRNTKETKELSEKQAKELIVKVEEQKAKQRREEEAQKLLEEGELDIDNEEIEYTVDPVTGELIPITSETSLEEKSNSQGEGDTHQPPKNIGGLPAGGTILREGNGEGNTPTTQKFSDLMSNRDYKGRIRKAVYAKWKDAPRTKEDLERFLRGKDIEVDSIGTSKADIEAWIKTIEDCR